MLSFWPKKAFFEKLLIFIFFLLDEVIPVRKELLLHPFHVVRQVGVVGLEQRLFGDGRVLGDGHEPEDNAVNLGHLGTENKYKVNWNERHN